MDPVSHLVVTVTPCQQSKLTLLSKYRHPGGTDTRRRRAVEQIAHRQREGVEFNNGKHGASFSFADAFVYVRVDGAYERMLDFERPVAKGMKYGRLWTVETRGSHSSLGQRRMMLATGPTQGATVPNSFMHHCMLPHLSTFPERGERR